MANTSPFFDLILPGKGEYRDAWWDPINSNFLAIDTWSQGIELELVAARFNMSSLSEFLAVGHETTGELKPTPEVLAAQISPVYGYQTPEPADFDLGARISQVEWETWYSREGQDNLRGLHAFRAGGIKNQVLEGAADLNGYPAWTSQAGKIATIDGRTTNLWLSIDGKLGRVRYKHDIDFTGKTAVTYQLYATHLADLDVGKIVVDGGTPAPTISTGFDVNSKPVYLSDTTKDFTTLDVKVGDLLVLEDTPDKGSYVVKTIAPGGTVTQLEIWGQFPVGGYSSITYKIYDPLRLSFGVDENRDSPVPAGKFYIGEVDYDTSAVTDTRPIHFRDTYISEWRAIDVGTDPLFTEPFDHRLDSDTLDISVQVSQMDDGTTPIEELSLTTVTSSSTLSLSKGNLAVLLSNTYSFNQGTLPQFTQGAFTGGGATPPATHAPDQLNPGTLPTLSGTVALTTQGGTDYSGISGAPTAAFTENVYTDSSVKVKWTKSQLWVKNAVSGKFYKDYDGTARKTGFLRVIVRKRG